MARRNAFVNHTLAISLISEGSGGGTPPKGGYFIKSKTLCFCPGTWRIFPVYCCRSMDLQWDLRRF